MKTIAVVTLATFALAACGQGAAERAGEDADSAYEETTEGARDLTDGPLENLGEGLDDAWQQHRAERRGDG
jgi:hypothetical protein